MVFLFNCQYRWLLIGEHLLLKIISWCSFLVLLLMVLFEHIHNWGLGYITALKWWRLFVHINNTHSATTLAVLINQITFNTRVILGTLLLVNSCVYLPCWNCLSMRLWFISLNNKFINLLAGNIACGISLQIWLSYFIISSALYLAIILHLFFKKSPNFFFLKHIIFKLIADCHFIFTQRFN